MSVLAWLVALVCFVVAALLGFGVFAGSRWAGWVALGLVCVCVAELVGGVAWPTVRRRAE